MTLDEAIKHCEEQAEIIECAECAREHRLLAEWLKELKQTRQMLQNIKLEIGKQADYYDAEVNGDTADGLYMALDIIDKYMKEGKT